MQKAHHPVPRGKEGAAHRLLLVVEQHMAERRQDSAVFFRRQVIRSVVSQQGGQLPLPQDNSAKRPNLFEQVGALVYSISG